MAGACPPLTASRFAAWLFEVCLVMIRSDLAMPLEKCSASRLGPRMGSDQGEPR